MDAEKTQTDQESLNNAHSKILGPHQEHAAVTQKLMAICSEHLQRNNPTVDLSFCQREALHMICRLIGGIVNGDPDQPMLWKGISYQAQQALEQIIEKNHG